MADLNFPTDPYVGQEYSIGSRSWVWNGNGWQLQSGIISTNPFVVVSAEITTSTNSTSTLTGALVVAGGAGIGGDVYVGGNVTIESNVTVTNSVTIGNSLYNGFTVPAILAGTPVILDSFDVSMYRTAKYLVQIVDYGHTPNLVHSTELLLTHDANGSSTLGYIVQYGIVTNSSELGTWDAVYDVGSNNMHLEFTPNYTPGTMIIKVNRVVLTV